ncbi:hypothetical protein CGMCC3_g11276 [Colletotrichum fructicola]|nr:uncharacterized protein CGMCC3_g11276 [Colletotrichum fructicola]KAE9572637.1 hypothetical protein CGMCC3_g11276 [Colletotrichum fructicola]
MANHRMPRSNRTAQRFEWISIILGVSAVWDDNGREEYNDIVFRQTPSKWDTILLIP